ncbi:MAG: hypothetical protein ACTSR8_07465 [Promethearchaeota archaeon]
MARKKKHDDEPEPTYKEPSTSYDDTTTTSYEDTMPSEGEVILKDGSEEGLKAQINVIENVNIEQNHEMEISDFEFTGTLQVKNPSSVDRIWDINIAFESTEGTNLESSEIYIRELGTDEETGVDARDFSIEGEAQSLLLVKEFISTLPEAYESWDISKLEREMLKDKSADEEEVVDDEGGADDEDISEDEDYDTDGSGYDTEAEELPLESYGISIGKVNTIMMLIAVRSLFEQTVNDLKIVKHIPSELENITIIDTSIGLAEIEGDQIIWTIDELEPEVTIFIKVSAEIQVETKDPVKTGTIEVTYRAASSFTGGLSVESFGAYSRNRFTIDEVERDEMPGVWDCSVLFENISEFSIELLNVSVASLEDTEANLVTFDAENPILLPAGAQWKSAVFELESEDYPSLRKQSEFRVLHEMSTEVSGTIAIGDVELVLASIIGDIDYIVPEEAAEELMEEEEEGVKKVIKVPTYKESIIDAILKVTNDGSAPLNEMKWRQQYFTDEFQPPTAEEIKCIWDGEEITLTDEMVTFEDNVLTISFKDLKDTDWGMFEADSTMEFQYPIHVVNPAEDARFESQIIINANTYPRSQELEYIPEMPDTPVIVAVHIRRKYRIGKNIMPSGALGEYEIVLHVVNLGNMPLKNIHILDKVPDSFERSDFSLEPEDIQDEKGEDIIKWELEEIQPEEEVEITYMVRGTGDFNASDLQYHP